jgi:uncharacterized protein with PIN domain
MIVGTSALLAILRDEQKAAAWSEQERLESQQTSWKPLL